MTQRDTTSPLKNGEQNLCALSNCGVGLDLGKILGCSNKTRTRPAKASQGRPRPGFCGFADTGGSSPWSAAGAESFDGFRQIAKKSWDFFFAFCARPLWSPVSGSPRRPLGPRSISSLGIGRREERADPIHVVVKFSNLFYLYGLLNGEWGVRTSLEYEYGRNHATSDEN
jgi:hypothetical protein